MSGHQLKYHATSVTRDLQVQNRAKIGKRSQGSQRGTKLTQVSRKADRVDTTVGASGIAAHRITSSAWKRSVGGMVRPRALAVLRLMTSSNFIGCSTGRSAGLAPFKILST